MLFPAPFTSNLELIHISILETDMSDLTKGMAGPLSSFQGMAGGSLMLRNNPSIGYKHSHDSSDILLERQIFCLKIAEQDSNLQDMTTSTI